MGGLNREDEVVKKRPPSPESPSVQNQTTSAAAEPVVSRPDDGTDSNSTTFSSAHHTHPSHNGSHGMKKPDFDYDAYDKYVNNIVNRRPHSRQRSGPASSPRHHSNRDSNREGNRELTQPSGQIRPAQPSRSEKYASEAELLRSRYEREKAQLTERLRANPRDFEALEQIGEIISRIEWLNIRKQ